MSAELIITIIGQGKSKLEEDIDKRELKGEYVILSMIRGRDPPADLW